MSYNLQSAYIIFQINDSIKAIKNQVDISQGSMFRLQNIVRKIRNRMFHIMRCLFQCITHRNKKQQKHNKRTERMGVFSSPEGLIFFFVYFFTSSIKSDMIHTKKSGGLSNGKLSVFPFLII